MSRRGQITIFAILGFVVFLLVFFAFYFLRMADDVDSEGEFVQEYDARLEPLVNDVEYCIGELSRSAFEDIGLRGGFLSGEGIIHGLEPAYVNNGMELFEGSGLVMPYWVYFDGHPSCVDCDFIINIPPLSGSSSLSIESQVESYINDNMLSCLDNFNNYPDFIVTASNLEASVLFRSDDVFVSLNYPLLVEFPNGLEAEVSRFSSTIDLRFKEIYDLAVNLAIQTQFLDDEPFLDKSARSILTLLSLGGKDADIPPVVPDFEAGTASFKMWYKSKVTDLFKQTIQETIPHFQVIGSKDSFVPMSLNPYLNNIYSDFQFAMELDDRAVLAQTKIRFLYFENWPLYLDVAPSRGELIMPIKESGPVTFPLLGDLGMTRYEYVYDIVFPVLITLEEERSFDGEGFLFQFPVTVNILRNNPRANDFEELPSLVFDEDDFFESGFGALEQRTVPVRIGLVNAVTQAPVLGVSVLYTCGGQSIYLEPLPLDGSSSVLDTFVPPCIGGMFSINDGIHFAEPVLDDFLLGTNKNFVMDVYESRPISVGLSTHRFEPGILLVPGLNDYGHEQLPEFDSDRGWMIARDEAGRGGISLLDNESVFVMFNRVSLFDEPTFVRVANFNAPFDDFVVDLVPGTYEVTLFSDYDFGSDNLTIKNQSYSIGGEDIFFDEIEFGNSFIVGFMELKGDDAFVLSPADFLFMNRLHFVYPSFNVNELRFHQDLSVLEMMYNATNEYPEMFGVLIE